MNEGTANQVRWLFDKMLAAFPFNSFSREDKIEIPLFFPCSWIIAQIFSIPPILYVSQGVLYPLEFVSKISLGSVDNLSIQ